MIGGYGVSKTLVAKPSIGLPAQLSPAAEGVGLANGACLLNEFRVHVLNLEALPEFDVTAQQASSFERAIADQVNDQLGRLAAQDAFGERHGKINGKGLARIPNG